MEKSKKEEKKMIQDMIKSMKHLKHFEDNDYDGFAGVESDDPLMNEKVVILEKEHKLKNCIMIIDDCHVEIYYYPDMDNLEDDVMGAEETIYWKEFEDQEDILAFLGHEAKSLEEKGIPVNILHLYGFHTY